MTENKPDKKFEGVKIETSVYRAIQKEALEKDAFVYQIIERAWSAYLNAITQTGNAALALNKYSTLHESPDAHAGECGIMVHTERLRTTGYADVANPIEAAHAALSLLAGKIVTMTDTTTQGKTIIDARPSISSPEIQAEIARHKRDIATAERARRSTASENEALERDYPDAEDSKKHKRHRRGSDGDSGSKKGAA